MASGKAGPFVFDSEEQVVEAGERIERAEYWRTVTAIAEEVLAERPYDEDGQRDLVEQSVEGNYYIIYTYANLDVLRFTRHDDAYEERDVALPAHEGAYAVYQRVAFWAMHDDVMEELERLRAELPEPEDEDE